MPFQRRHFNKMLWSRGPQRINMLFVEIQLGATGINQKKKHHFDLGQKDPGHGALKFHRARSGQEAMILRVETLTLTS